MLNHDKNFNVHWLLKIVFELFSLAQINENGYKKLEKEKKNIFCVYTLENV